MSGIHCACFNLREFFHAFSNCQLANEKLWNFPKPSPFHSDREWTQATFFHMFAVRLAVAIAFSECIFSRFPQMPLKWKWKCVATRTIRIQFTRIHRINSFWCNCRESRRYTLATDSRWWIDNWSATTAFDSTILKRWIVCWSRHPLHPHIASYTICRISRRTAHAIQFQRWILWTWRAFAAILVL